MLKLIFTFIFLTIICSCTSTKSTLLSRDPSFSSQDFFNSSCTIYPPSSVTITNNKYSDYKEEDTRIEITKIAQDKINRISKSNVFIGENKVPEYFRGNLFKKDEGDRFLKNSKTKYLIFIQQVFVGKETKSQTSYNPTTGFAYNYDQDVTKAIMYFDIWNTENTTLIFSIEVEADVNDGWLINGLYSSFGNAINEFIDEIKEN